MCGAEIVTLEFFNGFVCQPIPVQCVLFVCEPYTYAEYWAQFIHDTRSGFLIKANHQNLEFF